MFERRSGDGVSALSAVPPNPRWSECDIPSWFRISLPSLPNTAAASLVRPVAEASRLHQAHLSGEWMGESRGQEGGARGPRVVVVVVGAVGQRGTVSPLSRCERDSGVSVLGLACSPPPLPRSLRPRSCFSLSLFVLAGARRHLAATRSGVRARGDAHASQARARSQPCLFWQSSGATY